MNNINLIKRFNLIVTSSQRFKCFPCPVRVILLIYLSCSHLLSLYWLPALSLTEAGSRYARVLYSSVGYVRIRKQVHKSVIQPRRLRTHQEAGTQESYTAPSVTYASGSRYTRVLYSHVGYVRIRKQVRTSLIQLGCLHVVMISLAFKLWFSFILFCSKFDLINLLRIKKSW